jgi:carboxypeptidase Taq
MYATQLYQCALSSVPELEASLAKGDFKPLRQWLREHIHEAGSLHTSGDALMQAVTGRPLDPSVYVEYLRGKYKAIYKL